MYQKRRKPLFILLISKRILIGVCIVIGLMSAVWFLMAPPDVPVLAPYSEAVSGRKIVIDAGHGGVDPGAKAPGIALEKDINLDIAMHLKRLFSKAGVYVVMIREADHDLAPDDFQGGLARRKKKDLEARVNLANDSGADLFLSIHANSFPGQTWSGAQTFYNAGETESNAWARAVQNELVNQLGPNNRKAKSADFRVLSDTKMPAILVEVGFLSNPREARLLADEEYRRKVAESIYQGTVNYLIQKYNEEHRARGGGAPGSAPGDGAPGGAPADQPGLASALHPEKLHLQQDEALLYFGSVGNEDALQPEIRLIPGLSEKTTLAEQATAILTELIRGPGEQSILVATLPPTTKVISAQADANGIITVDFSEELVTEFWGGGRSEQLMIFSIVNTLTEIEGISGVKIRIAGRSDVSIGGHISLDDTFRRNDTILGIWKE
jgi:N-acetylmuramoyl-L-alanine amidase